MTLLKYIRFLLLINLIHVTTADLFVTANTYELIGFVSNAVTMYATVRGDPRPTADDITWLKMLGNLPEDRIIITYDTATNESRLRITELEYSDAGTYYCQVNVNGASKSVSMSLRVVDERNEKVTLHQLPEHTSHSPEHTSHSPELTSQSLDTLYLRVEPGVERVSGLISSKAVGQDALFSVTVSGNPLPTAQNITWAKLDDRGLPTTISHNRVQYADGNKEFTITDLVISDEGWYKCLVTTDEGRAEVEFVLYVLGMRDIQATGYGVVGNSVNLTCVATYFNMLQDNPTVAWYRYDAPDTPLTNTSITRDVSDHAISTLTLADLDWSDDGQYFCSSSYTGYPDNSIYNATLHIRGVTTNPEDRAGVDTNNASLSCVASGDPTIHWQKTGGGTVPGQTNTTSLEGHVMAYLYFTDIQPSDEGEYKCVADYGGLGEHSSASAQFTVYELTENPEAQAVEVGQSVELVCDSNGTPGSVRWYKDQYFITSSSFVIISTNGSRSTLTISDTELQDKGFYQCEYEFTEGVISSSSAYLSVRVPLELEYVTHSPAPTAPPTVTFSTLSPSTSPFTSTSPTTSPPAHTTSRLWRTITAKQTTIHTNQLTLYRTQDKTLHELTSGISAKGFSVEPHFAVGVEDNSASFTCVVHGETEATITWYKSESPITTTISTTYSSPYTTSTLAISSLQHSTDDEAEIVCRAQFTDPQLSLSSEVAVLTVLRISAPPANTAVVDTLTATLTCIVDAGGVIAWYNGSGLLDGETEETLVFSPVSVEHQGSYHCQATFAADGNYTFGGTTASEAVTLTVHRFTTVPETQYLIVGDTATFSCEGSGTPETIWYKGEEELQRTSPLVLTDVTFEDDGSYCCRINYTAGEIASEWVELHVRGVSTSPVQTTGVLGGSVLLQCTATGSTQPTFYWTRDHVNISGEATSSFSDPYTDTNFTYTGVVEEDATAEFRCVAVFLGQSHSSQPASITVLEVTGPPADVYGVVGTSASLSCSTAGPPAPASFSWLQDQLLLQGQERYAFTTETELDTTLTISELERSDDGEYACVPTYEAEALFLGGNTTSEAASLTIIGLTEPPVQTIVKVGDTAIFTCKADAVPVPTLSWYKDATALTDGVSAPTTTDGEVVSYLTIEDVGDDDVAPYSCTAFYPSLGEHTSENANLRFRGIEEAPLVTRAVIGLSNQLNCTARGEAVADMAWTANGTVIAASSLYNIITSSNYDGTDEQDLIDTRTIMTISEVSLNIAYLEIQCVATWLSNGQASEVSSDPVSFYALYVYDSPGDTIAVRYTKVELSCIATGTPLIRWDRSGRTYGVGISDIEDYTRTTSTLIIGNVTTADEGNIWCVAEYAEGMHDSNEATLTVVGIVTEPATTTTSQRGQSIQFTCTVDRYPANNVTWFKGDTQIHGYENRKNMTITTEQYLVEYVLWISSITEDDMAAYYCVVDYPQGTQTSQPAYLLIEEPPEITLIVATGGEKEGDSIELLCQATGVPKPDITWRRGGQEFPADDTVSVVTIYNEPGSSLVMINSSTSEDQGVYSCVASNGVGDTAIMETELVIESAVRAVTVVSASSLLGFIVAVCTALMLFALYKKRKRKRLHPNEETKIPPTPNEEDVENHVYDNEASIFGDVKSCEDDDLEYESSLLGPTLASALLHKLARSPQKPGGLVTRSLDINQTGYIATTHSNHAGYIGLGTIHSDQTHRIITVVNTHYTGGIECDDDIPTVEPPDDNPALFLMPDRTSKELPPLTKIPSDGRGDLLVLHNTSAGLLTEDEDCPIGLTPLSTNTFDNPSPCPSGYISGTDLTSSSSALPLVEERSPPNRRLSLLTRDQNLRESPDPHVPYDLN